MSTTTSETPALSESSSVLYNTYRLLGLTLANSALFSGINMALGSIQLPILVFIIGAYGLMYMVYRNRDKAAGIAYTFAFTGFMGFTLGPLINATLSLDGGSLLLMNSLGSTAVAFLAASAYGLRTRRNLSRLNSIIGIGGIVLLIAMAVGLMTNIPGLQLALSVAFSLYALGCIVLQTNSIVTGGERNYIMATITLYVAIYNLFVSLLSLLGLSRD